MPPTLQYDILEPLLVPHEADVLEAFAEEVQYYNSTGVPVGLLSLAGLSCVLPLSPASLSCVLSLDRIDRGMREHRAKGSSLALCSAVALGPHGRLLGRGGLALERGHDHSVHCALLAWTTQGQPAPRAPDAQAPCRRQDSAILPLALDG